MNNEREVKLWLIFFLFCFDFYCNSDFMYKFKILNYFSYDFVKLYCYECKYY